MYYDIENKVAFSGAINENITIMLDEANNKQKEVFNIQAADTGSFSEVKDIIAVIGITKEAGSSLMNVLLFAATAIGIIGTDVVRDEVQHKEVKIEINTSSMMKMRNMVETLVESAQIQKPEGLCRNWQRSLSLVIR
ncbi:MAG: hypothetical protein Q4E78_01485 [Eubacteriales bacterium]|nr:hypothetical protein [Eubacteriales bacterium]